MRNTHSSRKVKLIKSLKRLFSFLKTENLKHDRVHSSFTKSNGVKIEGKVCFQFLFFSLKETEYPNGVEEHRKFFFVYLSRIYFLVME